MHWRKLFLTIVAIGLCGSPATQAQYGDSDGSLRMAYRRDLAYRLEIPLAEGRNVEKALTAWFAAEKLRGEETDQEAMKLYLEGMEALRRTEALPPTTWPQTPEGITFRWLEEVPIPDLSLMFGESDRPAPGVRCRIVEFTVDDLKQYGVILQPEEPGVYPLMLYLHGAAFGVPAYSLPWLSRLAARGYVIAAPSLRGEDLFAAANYLDVEITYRSEGEIENLDGEVNDALGMVDAAFRLESVQPGKFAILAHSFGAGVGLLTAARSDRVSCVISYDAWLVNPFRYYWDRLRGGSNNWLSWEEYVEERSVAEQLSGLMRRSIVHHAEQLEAPLLLFTGGAYNGSVFHQTHRELVDRLEALEKSYRYEIIPGGSHNFVLYPGESAAKKAFAIQDAWLQQYHPPVKPATP